MHFQGIQVLIQGNRLSVWCLWGGGHTTASASAPQETRRAPRAARSAGVWDGDARGTSTRSTVRPVVSFTSCVAGLAHVTARLCSASAANTLGALPCFPL